MREFFSQFGKVVDSTVMLDRETGRSKGFGFVSFEDTDVTPFLGFGNLEIDGKMVSGLLFFFVAGNALSSLSAGLLTLIFCFGAVADRCQTGTAALPA